MVGLTKLTLIFSAFNEILKNLNTILRITLYAHHANWLTVGEFVKVEETFGIKHVRVSTHPRRVLISCMSGKVWKRSVNVTSYKAAS